MAKQLLSVSVFGVMKGQLDGGGITTKMFNKEQKVGDWKGIRSFIESVTNDGDLVGGGVIDHATFETMWWDGRNYVTHFTSLQPGKLLADLFMNVNPNAYEIVEEA